MENREQYDELLIKYLVNEANEEEETFVVKWMSADEQNRQYFEALKNTWRLMAIKQGTEKINVGHEWNYLKQTIAQKQQEQENELTVQEGKSGRAKVYKLLIATAIAASILLVIGLGWNLLFNKKAAIQPVAENNSTKADSLIAIMRHEVNTSGKPEKLVLKDGSVIVLADNSEVSFQEPFTNNKRDITLIGKADFKVAKDKTKPFTVYSGAISTTALGTMFTVTAFKQEDKITVRLFEGKVVVKSVNSARVKLKNDYYLLPGQELVYNTKSVTANIKTFKQNTTAVPEYSKDNPSVPNSKGSWYMFNNQSLEQVFEQLKEMYHTDIVYSKTDVSKMYFIGRFNKADSLETILHQIGSLNNLKISKENNRFIISK